MHFLRERGKAVWVVLTKCFLPLSSPYIHHQEFHPSIPRGVFPPPPFPLIAGVAKSPLSPFPLTVLSRKSLEREKKEENEKEGKEGCVVCLVSLQLFPFQPLSINGWKEELEGFLQGKRGKLMSFKKICVFFIVQRKDFGPNLVALKPWFDRIKAGKIF